MKDIRRLSSDRLSGDNSLPLARLQSVRIDTQGWLGNGGEAEAVLEYGGGDLIRGTPFTSLI
jgi:hypothetical protein